MSKTNFTKTEAILNDALNKLAVEQLTELATIANLLSESKPKVDDDLVDQVLTRFQNGLKQLKKHDAKLYARLNISKEEEKRLFLSAKDLTQEDWIKIKSIWEKIEELKKELHGQPTLPTEEDEKRIEEQRVEHINKRFNVRKGWLPLK